MSDNLLFDDDPPRAPSAAPAPVPVQARVPVPAPAPALSAPLVMAPSASAPAAVSAPGSAAGGFLKFAGIAIFVICLISGFTMYLKLENDRMWRQRDDRQSRQERREPDPYAGHYFPGTLTLLVGSIQGLVVYGLGVLIQTRREGLPA